MALHNHPCCMAQVKASSYVVWMQNQSLEGGGNWQVPLHVAVLYFSLSIHVAVLLAGRSTYKDQINHSQADRPELFLIINLWSHIQAALDQSAARGLTRQVLSLHCHLRCDQNACVSMSWWSARPLLITTRIIFVIAIVVYMTFSNCLSSG